VTGVQTCALPIYYYDFLPVDPARLGVAIADVSGTGVSAALLMASLRAALHAEIPVTKDLALLTAKLNDFVHGSSDAQSFISFFLGLLDRDRGELHYVNAGHNPPLLFRNGASPENGPDAAESLDGGGLPVGMFARSQYRSERVQLHDGDVLVAYTDGVVEALNPQQEEFGEERLSDIIRPSLSLSAAEICKRIAERLQAFVAESPQWDDITLVVMKVKPE
jgi:sigma-B regulation protein RsbU (phosphoserine phosphatase)